MNISKYFKNALPYAFVGVSLLFVSCNNSDDDTPNPDPDPGVTTSSKYVLSFQDVAADNSTVDFLLEVPDLASLQSGELSVKGQGIPQIGWRFAEQAGNSVFSIGFSDDNRAIAYQLNEEGSLTERTNFTFDNNLDKTIARIDKNTLLTVDLARAVAVSADNVPSIPELVFTIINGETGQAERIESSAVDNQLNFQNDPENPVNLETSYLPWITGMELRGNQLFVSYHKLAVDGSFKMIEADKANVAILNYPEMTVSTLLEEDRANAIGINSQTGLHQTENNTMYTFSSSASNVMGFFGETDNPTTILRILPGATNFDDTYDFDVENAPNGGKIFWMDYVGNNKAIARILAEDNVTDIGDWGVFSEQGNFFKLVIIDLEAKTVTNVSGMPLHANRYTANTYLEDGKAYISARTGAATEVGTISDAGETSIYIIDPEAATAIKGATIDGVAVKGIFKISNE
ncbi:DUF4374 domain-containing protein [Aquimarina sp. ERC-38]|uniref:DUF4374 domain-containing protein n=1 Tax=Aquimarina sp. ERC-38 TaxID=2949996 RepID=UPI002245D20C|nr:DUF4374 domain-containing protein [Aquimarina sp. ERC-38]UZO80630.1 DUF4374 domain-containing protein [Aquimarina sp. ERC-38]